MNKGTFAVSIASAAFAASAFGQFSTSFEAPTYTSGNVSGQDSWITPSRPEHARVLTAPEIAAELATMGIVEGTTVRSGSQALFVSGSGGSSSTSRPIGGFEGEDYIALDIYARPLTGTSIGNFFFTMENSGGTRAAAVRFGPTTIDYYTAINETTSDWVSSGVAWDSENADTWYHLRLEADYATRTYNVFADGTQLNENPLTFYNVGSDSFGQVRVFRGSGQAGGIVDDLTVTVIPEPGMLSIFALGAGAMLLRRRRN